MRAQQCYWIRGSFLIGASEITLVTQLSSRGGFGAVIMHFEMHSFAPSYILEKVNNICALFIFVLPQTTTALCKERWVSFSGLLIFFLFYCFPIPKCLSFLFPNDWLLNATQSLCGSWPFLLIDKSLWWWKVCKRVLFSSSDSDRALTVLSGPHATGCRFCHTGEQPCAWQCDETAACAVEQEQLLPAQLCIDKALVQDRLWKSASTWARLFFVPKTNAVLCSTIWQG